MYILLVEDDPLLRSVAKAVLQKAGFEAIEAGDGMDGYKIIRKIGGSIDLLLADVNLPSMDGLTLANSARNLYSHIPVLLISGEVSVFQNPPSRYLLLKKPFSKNELIEAVREAIAETVAGKENAANSRLRKPSRTEVVEQWWTHVQQLHQVSAGLSRQFPKVLTEQKQGLHPAPDVSAAIDQAEHQLSVARQEHIRALRILTDLTTTDQTPVLRRQNRAAKAILRKRSPVSAAVHSPREHESTLERGDRIPAEPTARRQQIPSMMTI